METILKDRYQLQEILGQGSMGITYKARDLSVDGLVAAKVLHFARVQEWKALELFEREAEILRQLDHPRIPAYIDYFSTETASETTFVLVQEFVEGKTLQKRVEEGWRGTEENILAILLQLLEICNYLHTHQPCVIHRDINPKNIILTPDHGVYLVDFGTGREIIRTTVYGGSTIVGTFGYIPFEQFSGRATPASDYYAIGGTLLYLLTHRHPADFQTEGLQIIFPATLQASPQLLQVLKGLLEPDATQRLSSPEAVKKVLEEIPEEVSTSPVSSSFPHKIRQIEKDDRSVRFEIPISIADVAIGELHKKFSSYRTNQSIAIVIASMTLGFLSIPLFNVVFLLPVFTVGGFMLTMVLPYWLWAKSTQHVIEMTPEHLNLSEKRRNKESPVIAHISIADLHPSDIVLRFQKTRKPVLGINYGSTTFEFGCANVTEEEVQWLVQELQAYLSKYRHKNRVSYENHPMSAMPDKISHQR